MEREGCRGLTGAEEGILGEGRMEDGVEEDGRGWQNNNTVR